MTCICRRRGINWKLDLDEGIDLCIYLLGSYEPRVVNRYSVIIREGDVVFDIGANIGAHTLHFARLVGDRGRVYAFEPTDYCAKKIGENLALNPNLAGRVSFMQYFLVSEAAQTVPTRVYSRWPVSERHADLHEEHCGKPETLAAAAAHTADEVCLAANIARLDFVKIDVDGFESSVLAGFREGIRRFRPIILIELAPFLFRGKDDPEFANFVRLICGLGYRFTDAATGQNLSDDSAEIRRQIPKGGSMNCILYPTS